MLILALAIAGCGGAQAPVEEAITSEEIMDLQSQVSPGLGQAGADAKSENVLQDFEEGNGTAGDQYSWDYGKAGAGLTGDQTHSGRRALRVAGDKFGVNLAVPSFNVQDFDRIFVWIYDCVGDNTVEFELTDADGKKANGWSKEKSRKNEWTRVSMPLAQFRDRVDLTRLRAVEFYEWNPGIYYFDDLGVEKSGYAPPEVATEVAPPVEVDLRPAEPLGPKDVLLQDFEPGNGTAGQYYWDYGQAQAAFSAEKLMEGSRRAVKTRGDKFGINFSSSPVNLSGASGIFVYVYDCVGDNTVELELHDVAGRSFKIWSTDKSMRNRWARVDFDLTAFQDRIDLSRVKSLELYEWNQGAYYFDNVGMTRR